MAAGDGYGKETRDVGRADAEEAPGLGGPRQGDRLDLQASGAADHWGRVGARAGPLADRGMLTSGKLGRAKPYYLAETFPLLPGLRSMVMYATGIVAVLREQLAVEEEIVVAFIFGSLAAGDDRPNSDVDLMVVGSIDGRRLSQLVRHAERQTGREVNQVQYSAREFSTRLREGGSFLESVMEGAKILIKGEENALRRIAGRRQDTAAPVPAARP